MTAEGFLDEFGEAGVLASQVISETSSGRRIVIGLPTLGPSFWKKKKYSMVLLRRGH